MCYNFGKNLIYISMENIPKNASLDDMDEVFPSTCSCIHGWILFIARMEDCSASFLFLFLAFVDVKWW